MAKTNQLQKVIKNSDSILQTLKKYADYETAQHSQKFFKTAKGEYGYGDLFLGVRVPLLRKLAKFNNEIALDDLEKCIASKYHEMRFTALLILVDRSRKLSQKKEKKEQQRILNFYLDNLDFVNNWDLVDLSAHSILGQAILDGLEKKEILNNLAQSKNLWRRRIAIIATWALIKNGEVETTLRLAKILLGDKEDLMHKAMGWMLREGWKRQPLKIESFLAKNYHNIPRVMLRYAIERMEKTRRQMFLSGMI